MTIQQAIATIVGSFVFPFVIQMIWGKMVEHWGAIGGWLAAAFIVGTVWAMNHGIPKPMITQAGSVWIDMGLAAGVGVFVSTLTRGGKLNKAMPNLAAALVGGLIGGVILSFFL
ncbi:Lin0368 family putative glycerol transporter subunit [Streptococcus cuniculi]|uniref:Uncharacterized protein n=1 Tax=Streptococcus cuniculi TaxID=1432788 RepID=A0A4Y9J8V8_9STRE|nr:hypothetical protein [Streptococcus cuniculi]MBF0778835.1 hypothetical protein [Streptococcus cuniculi]TFU97217.1 hypothetical protein E4T82_08915 [Streptococcus cuniculi]